MLGFAETRLSCFLSQNAFQSATQKPVWILARLGSMFDALVTVAEWFFDDRAAREVEKREKMTLG